ncbi:uncharacterized protein LOC113796224 [Dermatophagoides pteronyssinus]|uniref:Uncharacterized protein LOC113796224 isoform X1 n=1 Tax=Dermatophagoides pteronyssinus TaxID=6956 RepID=A0A6P6YBA4_DERPT|nr:uncharacterized protein LOC113796224 isoform X1 [Dermatophagoides pteronyssinus]
MDRINGIWNFHLDSSNENIRQMKFYSTVTGAVILHMLIGAVQMGNIITYITSYMRFYVSKDNNYGRNTWISSVIVLAFTIFTIISGYMTRKVSFRAVIFLGALLITLGNFLASLAVNASFEYLVVTYGFIQNAGCGLIYSIVIVTSAKWKPEYRGFIAGLIIAMDSISTFITMELQTMYFNPDNIPPDDRGYFTDPDILERVPHYFRFVTIIYIIMGAVGTLLMFVPPADVPQPSQINVSQQQTTTTAMTISETIDNNQSSSIINDGPQGLHHRHLQARNIDDILSSSSGIFPSSSLTENLIENDYLGILKEQFDHDEEYLSNINANRTNNSSDKDLTDMNNERRPIVKNYYGVRKALRTRMAMILLITFGLSTNSSYFIGAMGKPYGQTFISDDHFLSTVIAFANIANCFGSFFCGKLLDRFKFKRTMIFINCLVSASYFSFIFSYYFAHKLLYTIWIMVINFASIGFFSSHLPEVMNKFGAKHATAIYGIIHTGPVISSLALSPVFELLINYYGWFPTFLTVGFLNFISMVIIMIFYRAHTVI